MMSEFQKRMIHDLLKIMTGDLQTIHKCGEKAWFEEVAGILLFVDPSMQAFDIM